MEHLDAAEVTRFLRGQLPPERASQVESHLATCKPCGELLAADQEVVTEVPADLEASYATGAAFAAGSDAADAAPLPSEPATPQWIKEGRAPQRGEQVGRYLVLERVGQGGMGTVYSAWDPDLGRRVAIKLLRMDKHHAEGRAMGQARLLREAQAMARVTHPHVIAVYDVGTLGEGVFVAMEFVDGTTLKKWIKEKPRPWREVLDTFVAAGRGLAGAHSAGLVHRDFKPDNVLIGKDGRIGVTDFGLARLAEEGVEPPRAALPNGTRVDESPELAQLTQEGHAVGTLMYMAPEQRRGEAPDARADQFSFCVALYWALFGVWPFERQRSSKDADYSPGSSHKGTSRPSQRAGDERPVDPSSGAFEPPSESRVPTFVRRAILRGLSPEPKDRFSSMEALLSQLEYRPRRARLVASAAAAVLLASVGGYAWYAHEAAARQALVCTGAEQKLVSVWNEAVRIQVENGLIATGSAQASEVTTRVKRMLDAYTRGWVEASTEACRATRIRGEQTEALLGLRVLCLERRLKDVKAVTDILASADSALVLKAADTVSLLPSLQACADVTTLSQVEPPPDSPQARQEIERISGQLSQVKALTDAGRYKQAAELAAPAVEAASALGYRPLEAEALFYEGSMEARSGSPVEGERHLMQSFWTAMASRNDPVMTRAASGLVFAVGFNPDRLEEALRWSEFAKAALARMGGNEELEGELFNYLGVTYTRLGKNAEALAALQQALQRVEHALGPDHVRRANILGNMGNAYRDEGKFEDSVRVITEAIGIRERLSGPKHPIVGYLYYGRAQSRVRMEDFENAEADAKRSLEIHIAARGPEHPETGDAYDVVGQVYLMSKRYPQAVEPFTKALAIKEKALGPEDEAVGYSALGLGLAHVEQGEAKEAQPLLERALKLTHDPRTQGDAYFGLARAMDAQGRKGPEVLALAQKALDAFQSVKEADSAKEISDWISQHQKPAASAKGRLETAKKEL
ncbi:tetratricopeptide repeat protein [Hyalangium versicolor]|uniref:serine/threonine-protein kinase n=1 Tax=Hyalangium versicolor TaxID=2861190 RepID=UPI001CCDEFCA|nr:tetratricopeptide repeat protein [Hyalangium versicolor]